MTFDPKVSSAWIVGVIAMSGVANAGPYVEHSSVTESLREIELAVSDATSSDPRDYVLQDGDQRLTAEHVSQDVAVIAFIVAAGDPIIPTLLDGLALERFEGDANLGMVIEYGETMRVLARGQLDKLRVPAGSAAPQQPALVAASKLREPRTHDLANTFGADRTDRVDATRDPSLGLREPLRDQRSGVADRR